MFIHKNRKVGGYQPTNVVSPTPEQAQFFLGVAVTNSVLKFK